MSKNNKQKFQNDEVAAETVVMSAYETAKFSLEKMTPSEIVNLIVDAKAAHARKSSEAVADTRKKLENIAAEAGLTLRDILGNNGGYVGIKAPAKYRNPENADQTWSGRGQRPGWMKAELAKGKNQEDFRIAGTAAKAERVKADAE